MSNPLLSLLNIQWPIIQAPMVGVSTPRLAAAVSNAGGLGSIGIGASNVEQARALLRETAAHTDKPFNVNVFCHQPAVRDTLRESRWLQFLAGFFAEFGAETPVSLREIYTSFVEDADMLQMLLEEKPAVVSFHFGLPPQPAIDALKAAGILLLCSVTSLAEALAAQDAGVHALVAQGYEAGGHRGVFDPRQDLQMGTCALVRVLVDACRLPLIAAGGIMDGAGINAVMRLGASAAQLGTAFILCPESSANGAYREALKGPRAHQTHVTSVISGRPARGMVNRNFTSLEGAGIEMPDYPLTYDANKALNAAAAARANSDFAVQWAGQGAPLARELPAAALVKLLAAEMQS
ncbi:2-nitropropane dioxygenase [Pseudomonas putida]|jgi:nitronate monooxygenase|uniref:Nitronate monooxygenase n=1 Tax=Pseudomonas umsongensis TaxID=198618 RepID=A0AAE6ZTX0_9PSED|nr:nitronate monooxygenase [Pseudomonas umsongensis]KEX91798.1 2-nitropropane dioxygenase [Pseudomonas putida]QJC79295.1 nitronate monooxygenase [Pseudomonas umsongensis]